MSVRVGLGVFVMNAKRDRFIVGIRGQFTGIGQGSLAIPGGHLEVGESFEDCARREVIEETGIEMEDVRFGTAVNNLFADGRHYVTIFMTGVAKVGQEPINREPTKCEGWSWISYQQMVKMNESSEVKLFVPLINLIESRPEFNPHK